MSSCSACAEKSYLLTQSSVGESGATEPASGPCRHSHFQGHTQLLSARPGAMLTLALPTLPLMLTGWSYPCPPLKPPLPHQSTTGSISDARWQIISGKEMGGQRGAVLVSGEGKKMLQVLLRCHAPLNPRVSSVFPPKAQGAWLTSPGSVSKPPMLSHL